MEQIYIYGDSLLKATVPDESFRYHFHLPEVMNWYPRERVAVTNRSKMGATSTKGLQLVEHDVARGMDARYALVAYGGNDSDYDWPAVAEDPALDHRPRTELPTFVETMRSAVKALREKGVQPVMMTLPPIDAARYLRFICRGGLSRERIMQWLGEEQMIYRHQEMYSDAGRAARVRGGRTADRRAREFFGRPPFFRSAGRRRNSPDYGRLPAAV